MHVLANETLGDEAGLVSNVRTVTKTVHMPHVVVVHGYTLSQTENSAWLKKARAVHRARSLHDK
jgi:hypothetical protein